MTEMLALAHFHFHLDELFVDVELLGRSDVITRDGYRIHFALPSEEYDFGLERGRDEAAFRGGWQRNDQWTCREITLVRLSVELDLPDGVMSDPIDRAVFDAADKALREAADAGRGYLHDYLNLVRTKQGQFWLAYGAQMPEVVWLTSVIDSATGERLRIGFGDPLRASFHDRESALSVDAHSAALRAVERGGSAAIPDLLLADAWYLAATSQTPQYREAVLLAAMAAEVKIKETLDDVCAEVARPLLAFALRNPRDVSVQAAALYDKAADAVVGRSLRREDSSLYKRLVRLFEDRNAVAHRAHLIEAARAREDVDAARKVMEWADGLQQAN